MLELPARSLPPWRGVRLVCEEPPGPSKEQVIGGVDPSSFHHPCFHYPWFLDLNFTNLIVATALLEVQSRCNGNHEKGCPAS